MADTNNCVFRSDLMSGTHHMEDMVSLRFYVDDTPAEVENGVIAKLDGYETGSREVYKAVAATAEDDLNDCVVIASPEVMYDERKKNLDEFVNEAGTIARGYILRSRNIFSLTAPGFVGGVVPVKGAAVGIGADGKLDAAGTGFGVCADIDQDTHYTYYAIRIGKTEAAAAAAGEDNQ